MAHSPRLTLIMSPSTTTSHQQQSGYWLLIYMIISGLAPRQFRMQIWTDGHLLFGRRGINAFCASRLSSRAPVDVFAVRRDQSGASFLKPREALSPTATPCWGTEVYFFFRKCHLKWLLKLEKHYKTHFLVPSLRHICRKHEQSEFWKYWTTSSVKINTNETTHLFLVVLGIIVPHLIIMRQAEFNLW